ncbi:iron complex transport system ATP-binding protein [Trueperella bonasi]|uniref:Iron complex transport system ATP-binding protein n=1 Tax=Trueperella bonasi TaxID=312286 RepID=A0ABT9NF49_9ACTO|nr:ABC transporter ATP-binding protein [Trueperella bonasi]MDP9805990.1 iron complex transport system ATP-binding protein [Trueperella bonasi]
MSPIELSHMQVSYGKRRVVNIDSLHLRSGAVHGLIGPNGAGKSTLLKAMLGLIPHAGSVTIDGEDFTTLSARDKATKVAYLTQDSLASNSFTGREVVDMARYARQSRFAPRTIDDENAVDRALATTGADAWANRPTSATSGGERQLTGLSRVLAQETTVLLLDEPVSALDLSHETRVLKMLRDWLEANGGRTVVVVLHDLTMAARYCDELVLLKPEESGATVCAQGTPEHVLTPEKIGQVYDVDVDVRRSAVTSSLVVTAL